MENPDTNELIEQYLNGSLSAADRQAVEARLIADSSFKAEVELHRQLHAEFTDPYKLQLRDLLSDIVQETPVPPPKDRFIRFKGLSIALLILMGAWLVWLWFSSTRGRTPLPSEQEEIQSPSSTKPVVISPAQDTPAKPLEKTLPPIAMADPAAFAANRVFEDRLESVIRSTGGTVKMQSPVPAANFTAQNGLTKLHFSGTVSADADTSTYPLFVKIYGNRKTEEPLFQVPLLLTDRNSASGQWAFSQSPRLRLPPGLYYYTLERRASEEVIFVGKLTVGKQ